MQEKEAQKNFVTGATIIALSHIVVKVIGALFRIPLANLIGPDGMAIYQASYSIYLVLFAISTAGIPVAISKLVSEYEALGNKAESKNVFYVSFRLLFIIGVAGTLILFFGAKLFAAGMGIANGYPAIMALAPGLFFISVSSVYRGYFQGRQNMLPTAVSEVIEAVFKLVVGLILANAFVGISAAAPACGGILGVTSGSVFCAVYLFVYYKKRGDSGIQATAAKDKIRRKELLKKIVYIAVPITLGSSVFTLTSTIDTFMVLRRLQSIGFTPEQGEVMFGYYSGYAITLFNLPANVIVGICLSIVPAIGAALALKKYQTAAENIASSVRITWQLALPAGIGMAALAAPILKLLYRQDFVIPKAPEAFTEASRLPSFLLSGGDATKLLTFLGVAVGLVCVTMVTNSILQALGRVWKPVINMLIGGSAKIILNFFLVGIPELNIMGAPVSTTVCYLLVTVLNLMDINRILKPKYGFSAMILKPFIATALMALTAIKVYGVFSASRGNMIATVAGMAAAVMIYFAAMIILRGFSKKDIMLLPKGEKICKKFSKLFSE